MTKSTTETKTTADTEKTVRQKVIEEAAMSYGSFRSGGGRDDGSRDPGSRDTGFRGVPVQIVANGSEHTPIQSGRMQVALGWHADTPDPRDWRYDAAKVTNDLEKVDLAPVIDLDNIPSSALNIEHCSPIEHQGTLGSCTAQAAVSLMEYEMKRRGVPHVEGSRLFVYKVTRKLLGWWGDSGGTIREAIKAIAAFGVPPEKHWPYDISKFEEEPTPFLYAYGQNYKALGYMRLDPRGQTLKMTEKVVKSALHNGYAVMCGFSVFSDLSNVADIPFPPDLTKARRLGGHAVLIVGYDQNHVLPDGKTVCPSFVIRNSWGSDWGYGGYGFLPIQYLLEGAAADFWTVYNTSWLEKLSE